MMREYRLINKNGLYKIFSPLGGVMSPEIEFLLGIAIRSNLVNYPQVFLDQKHPILGPNQTKAGKFLRILGLDRTRTCEHFDTTVRSGHGPKKKIKNP